MTLRALKAIPAAAAVLLLTCLATAQVPQPVPQFTDPANLRGERVKPRDGRELPIDQGARGLEQLLRKLNTRASLMLIVAHPDDEDGGMLTYYSRGLGARVAVLTLTRGEGGQNAMTGDFEDALGLLRTQELLSADRYMGVDQFFGTEVDFGFSKTKEEAFKKWTHERVLYDAVRSIRLYRPLVIAAVFIGGVTDGHGQHQVSGQIAQEAFKAAADPTVFPDMIAEGILPWQALKVYARVPMQSISDKGLFDYATGKYTAPRFENYVTGEVTTTVPSSDVVVHEGTTDPILSDDPAAPPRTYVQFARIGLGMQKSQIGGGVRVPPAGKFDVDYHLYGSALCSSPTHIKNCHPERSAQRGVEGSASPHAAALPIGSSSHKPESASFFDGIDTSIESIASLVSDAPALIRDPLRIINESLNEAQTSFDPTHPDVCARPLSEALQTLDLLIRALERFSFPAQEKASILHELHIKRVQLNDAIAVALSLSMNAETSSGDRPAGLDAVANLSVTLRSKKEALYVHTWSADSFGDKIEAAQTSASEKLIPNQTLIRSCSIPGNQAKVTRPYFMREKGLEQPFYNLHEASLRNAPATPPAFSCWAETKYNGSDIFLGAIAQHDLQPLSFVPSLSVSLSSYAQVLPKINRGFELKTTAHSIGNLAARGITIRLPVGWSSQPPSTVPQQGNPTYSIWTRSAISPKDNYVTASIHYPDSDQSVAESYRPIGYGGLSRTNFFTYAHDRIVPVDLNLPATHRIGYLPGTGDAVPEALASINLKPDTLTIADLTPAKLAQYDTVILGVRTYAAHPDLHGAPTQALLDYARSGGNVLVQYQTTEFTAEDAPYPLSLGSNEKVVDETDPVQLLDTKAPFLTTPNKITLADFNNWVEERGHGFLSSWDSHYVALTESHDPDQDPQRGGLITTNIGKGRWTYCAFALYRQLPEAVPGAFRLFVNLIAPATAKN